jgi:hypothetical protein
MMNSFNDLLEELAQAAYVADSNHNIWRIYKAECEKYDAVRNRYLGFFKASHHAHFVAMLMALCRLEIPTIEKTQPA